jgi:tetratricopeptide (TPR) repeat protein
VLRRLPRSLERSRQEIGWCLNLTRPLIASKGYGSAEVEEIACQARKSCTQIGNGPELFAALGALNSVYYNRGELSSSMELAKQMMSIAESSDIALLRLWSHYILGFIFHALGENKLASDHLAKSLALYDPNLSGSYGFVQDPGPTGLLHLALITLRLGYPDLALTKASEGLRLARNLSQPFTLAWVLNHSILVREALGDEGEANALCDENVALCSKYGFDELLESAILSQGLRMVRNGRAAEGLTRLRGVVANRKLGYQSLALAVLAQALCDLGQVDEGLMIQAEAMKKENQGEGRLLMGWLCQLKGELLLLGDAPNEIEAERCFRQAIYSASEQSDKLRELTSTIQLARLLARRHRRSEAFAMLSEIYYWFTEGFDTSALKEAKALLDEFNSKPRARQHNASSAKDRSD